MIEKENDPCAGGGRRGQLSDYHISHSNNASNGPNAKGVERFLRSFGRRRPTLAFKGDRGLFCRRYSTPRSASRGAEVLNAKGFECYFVGNSHRLPTLPNNRVAKPTKEDIELCIGVWVDVDNGGWDDDVPWALRTLIEHDPTYIAFTGGGYQAHWRFDEPTEDRADAEAINHWLAHLAAREIPGADQSCWTCEHLWRLPGTLNHRRGRRSILVHADWVSRLPLAECERGAPPERHRAVELDLDPTWVGMDDVLLLPDRARRMLNRCPDRHRNPDGSPDRSQHQWCFIQAALENGDINDRLLDTVAAVLLAPAPTEEHVSHATHEVRTKGGFSPRRDPRGHVERQIGKWLADRGIGEVLDVGDDPVWLAWAEAQHD